MIHFSLFPSLYNQTQVRVAQAIVSSPQPTSLISPSSCYPNGSKQYHQWPKHPWPCILNSQGSNPKNAFYALQVSTELMWQLFLCPAVQMWESCSGSLSAPLPAEPKDS